MNDSHTILLDRDGVINKKLPNERYVSSWDEFELLPGVLPALAQIARTGLRAVVVTNQRGIARGLVASLAVAEIDARMRAGTAEASGFIDAVYCCPHEVAAIAESHAPDSSNKPPLS